jgi:uncharacterized protein (TIGR02001 family)
VALFNLMELSMKSFASAAALATLFTAPLAYAAEPVIPVTANVSLVTKYKYRGIDQAATRGLAPAIQGGFDFSKNGFYVGNWNSSIGPIPRAKADVGAEIDVYGGYKGSFAKDFGYDVGLLQYIYAGASRSDTTELYGALSYDIFTFKHSLTLSKDYFGIGDTGGKKGRFTNYFDLSANYEIIKNLTLNAHLGYTWFSSGIRSDAVNLSNYIDYKAGATYDFGSGFSASGAIVGANKKKNFAEDAAKARLIVAITKTL